MDGWARRRWSRVAHSRGCRVQRDRCSWGGCLLGCMESCFGARDHEGIIVCEQLQPLTSLCGRCLSQFRASDYLLQVPANRLGYGALNLAQLKILQEVITLSVFVPFAVFYMHQPVRSDYLWAGVCLLGAVYFIFRTYNPTGCLDVPGRLEPSGGNATT